MFKGKFQDLSHIKNSNKPFWKQDWYLKYRLAYFDNKIPKRGNYWLDRK